MKDVLYVEMKVTSDTFFGLSRHWKILENWERMFKWNIFNIDEELNYKKILKENIHIYFSKGYLKLMYSFQTCCVRWFVNLVKMY